MTIMSAEEKHEEVLGIIRRLDRAPAHIIHQAVKTAGIYSSPEGISNAMKALMDAGKIVVESDGWSIKAISSGIIEQSTSMITEQRVEVAEKKDVDENEFVLSIDRTEQTIWNIVREFLLLQEFVLKRNNIVLRFIYFLYVHKFAYSGEISKFFDYSRGSFSLYLEKMLFNNIITEACSTEVEHLLQAMTTTNFMAPVSKIKFYRLSDRILNNKIFSYCLIQYCLERITETERENIERYRRDFYEEHGEKTERVEQIKQLEEQKHALARAEQEAVEEARRLDIFSKLETLPELQNISETNITLELVEKLRTRLQLRIGLTDIKRWLKTKQQSQPQS